MKAAQELYEGVEMQGMGAIGLITYMRTDSLRISEEAMHGMPGNISAAGGERNICPRRPRHV